MRLVLEAHGRQPQLAAQVGEVCTAQVSHLDVLELLPDALVGLRSGAYAGSRSR
jgi:hypothetical protein